MLLKFSKDLFKMDIYANGYEVATVMGKDKDPEGNRVYTYPKDFIEFVASIENPVLVKDNYQIFSKDYVTAETIAQLYAQPLRITEYDGISIEFEQDKYPGVWGPSIDTILFCRALSMLDFSNIKTVFEAGAGPGFISKYLLAKNSNIEKIVTNDISENVQHFYEDFNESDKIEFEFGSALDYLDKTKYDMVMCNPPYIPRPASIDDNPYEGLLLLSYLIENAKNYLNPGGILITNISSLCERLMQPVIENAGVEMELIDELEVPLKVFNVLNNMEWMRFLKEEKGMKEESKNGHLYWQRLKIVKISL